MAKARSGGGIKSTVNVRPPMKAGAPKTNIVSPGAVDRLGQALSPQTKPKPLVTGKAPAVPLGNAVANNVGAGGPGAGRVVHRAGSQASTPAPTQTPSPEGWALWPK